MIVNNFKFGFVLVFVVVFCISLVFVGGFLCGDVNIDIFFELGMVNIDGGFIYVLLQCSYDMINGVKGIDGRFFDDYWIFSVVVVVCLIDMFGCVLIYMQFFGVGVIYGVQVQKVEVMN